MSGAIDVFNDPYSRRLSAHKKRLQFEKLKHSKKFVTWKSKQYNYQKGRCAYCRVYLSNRGVITHIDHVDPLYYGGSNDLSNLVLSCKRCNLRKWVSNRYVYPEWINKNKEKLSLKRLKSKQVRQMKTLVRQELDEQSLTGELYWLKQI